MCQYRLVIYTMKATDSPSQISVDMLHNHLLSYNSYVPDKIQGLEELRLGTIPNTLVQRKKDGEPFLEKTEVASLVEWKLYVCPTDILLRKPQHLTSLTATGSMEPTVLIWLSSSHRIASKTFARLRRMHSRFTRRTRRTTANLSQPSIS